MGIQINATKVIGEPGAGGGETNVGPVAAGELLGIFARIPAKQKSAPLVIGVILPGARFAIGTAQDGERIFRQGSFFEVRIFHRPSDGPLGVGNEFPFVIAIPGFRGDLDDEEPSQDGNTDPTGCLGNETGWAGW